MAMAIQLTGDMAGDRRADCTRVSLLKIRNPRMVKLLNTQLQATCAARP